MREGEASKQYHNVKNWLFYIGLSIDIVVLFLIQATGASVNLRNFASSFSANPFIMHAIYTGVFCLILYILHFPFEFFLGYTWEHKFGLSNQKLLGWFWDDLKKAFLSLAIILVLVEIIYFLLGKFPNHWWVGAGCFWLLLSIFLARILPNVIIPLFYQYSKIENEDLRKGILGLFDRCHVPVQDVYTINLSSKTKKANAFVCGLGKKRRVVLGDTLVSNFSVPEIEAVVAHELGHYKNKDIIKLIAVNAFVVFWGFFLVHKILNYLLLSWGGIAISDIASLPIFTLSMMIFGFLVTPILNAYSRKLEVAADKFSLDFTKNREAFSSMMEKLGQMNLAELNPSWINEMMFYDHPPIPKRVQFAKNYQWDDA